MASVNPEQEFQRLAKLYSSQTDDELLQIAEDLVFNPLADDSGPFSVAGIMQAIKGSSAHRINAALAHKGRIWQEESFDRVLRREENIDDKVGYILENPVRAGLVKIASDYPWLWTKEMSSLTWGRTGEDARLSIDNIYSFRKHSK